MSWILCLLLFIICSVLGRNHAESHYFAKTDLVPLDLYKKTWSGDEHELYSDDGLAFKCWYFGFNAGFTAFLHINVSDILFSFQLRGFPVIPAGTFTVIFALTPLSPLPHNWFYISMSKIKPSKCALVHIIWQDWCYTVLFKHANQTEAKMADQPHVNSCPLKRRRQDVSSAQFWPVTSIKDELRPFEVQAELHYSLETPALLQNAHMAIRYLNTQSFNSNQLLRVRVDMNICNCNSFPVARNDDRGNRTSLERCCVLDLLHKAGPQKNNVSVVCE